MRALLAESDGSELRFHISSHDGTSSSIFDFKEHGELWPDISYERDLVIKSLTLETLVDAEKVDLRNYGALILDVQGAELRVLQGAGSILHHFRYIQAEAANFELYASEGQTKDVIAFLSEHGFVEHERHTFATNSSGKSCFELIFKRTPSW